MTEDGQTRVTFLDTETSGLDPTQDEIISAYALALDFPSMDEKGEFNQRFTPIGPVNPNAAKVNGYDPKDWGGVTRNAVSLGNLWYMTHGVILAGWNIQFDIGFLGAAFKSIRKTWIPKYHVLDVKVMYIHEHLADPSLPMSLSAVAARHGVEHTPHDAKSDTEATLHLYLKAAGLL